MFAECFKGNNSTSASSARDTSENLRIPTRRKLSEKDKAGEHIEEEELQVNVGIIHSEQGTSSGSDDVRSSSSRSLHSAKNEGVDILRSEEIEGPRNEDFEVSPAVVATSSEQGFSETPSSASHSSVNSNSRFGDRSSSDSSSTSKSSSHSVLGSTSSRGPHSVMSARMQGSGFRSVKHSLSLNKTSETYILSKSGNSSENKANKENESPKKDTQPLSQPKLGKISEDCANGGKEPSKQDADGSFSSSVIDDVVNITSSQEIVSNSDSSSSSANSSVSEVSSSEKSVRENVRSQQYSSTGSFKSAIGESSSSAECSAESNSSDLTQVQRDQISQDVLEHGYSGKYTATTSYTNNGDSSATTKNVSSSGVSHQTSAKTFTSSRTSGTNSSLTSSDQS